MRGALTWLGMSGSSLEPQPMGALRGMRMKSVLKSSAVLIGSAPEVSTGGAYL